MGATNINGAGLTAGGDGTEVVSLDDPKLYVNRELSWLSFNRRVLEEAIDPTHPLLERVKFLAICSSNMDEFFMVRVAGLMNQIEKGFLKTPPDGMTPAEQLHAIRNVCVPLMEEYTKCWNGMLLPELERAGICIVRVKELGKEQQRALRELFEREIFPVLTPLAMDISHPFPFISNLSLNLALLVKGDKEKELLARLKVPTDHFPRLVEVPRPSGDGEEGTKPRAKEGVRYVFLEDLVASNIGLLFPGMKVTATYPFRVTRSAEVEIALDQASDLLTAVEESVETRRIGTPVRLEIDKSMPDPLRDLFARNLSLKQDMVYKFDGPLGLMDFWQMLKIDRPDLKDEPFLPFTPPKLGEGDNIFSAIAKRDYVLYHPYDSFNIIVNLLRQAARDPEVLAIKLTLYRIDKHSPVIDALIDARRHGKSVAALVELKARFDEESNIEWAKTLEHEGVHVVYGLVDLKVHAKLLLIVRREGKHIARYSHLSSGNYNAVTSRVYGDIGYLTANPQIGNEVSHLFNALTGYPHKYQYEQLIVAPKSMRETIIAKIEREIKCHSKSGNGYISLKLNGLLDKDVIKALYKASMAGVRIDLNVRGLCSLRPGVKGVSDNISETSIVSRFLEHARICYFRNDGKDDVLLGSSDMMPRNLDSRIEVLFAVPDPRLRRAIVETMLKTHLRDNVKARRMCPDGSYARVTTAEREDRMDSQGWLVEHRGLWHDFGQK